jgi:tetratricopeptide (TPR) repeat protein
MRLNLRNVSYFVAIGFFFAIVPSVVKAAGFDRKEEDAFYVATKSYQDGFYAVALTLFDRYLRAYPESDKGWEARVYIGQCYFFQEKYLKALELFETLAQAPDASGVRDQVLYWLGEVYVKGRDFRQAESFYREVLDKHPQSSYRLPTYRSLAAAYLAERRFDDAIGTYRQILQEFPAGPSTENAAFGIVEALYQKRDFEALKTELDVFLKAHPATEKLSRARFYLAEAMYYLGRYEDSIGAYRECLLHTKDAAEESLARIGLGWAFLKLKRYDEAGQAFAGFTEEPAPVAAVLGRAVLALEQGACAEALGFYDDVIARDRTKEFAPIAHYGRAEALYHLDRFDEAIIEYRVSLDRLKEFLGGRLDDREL